MQVLTKDMPLTSTSNTVDFTYEKGDFRHKFSGKCQDYGLSNNLMSSKIIVGTFTRKDLTHPQNVVNALTFLVTQDQDKFVFMWCPTPLQENSGIPRWHCATGLLSPE